MPGFLPRIALWLKGFITRTGGMLVAPRYTLSTVIQGDKGGLVDLLLLLLLQVIIVQLPRVVAAILNMVQASYSAGISTLLNTIGQSMVLPLAAVLLATVVFGWLARKWTRSERHLDLVSLAMLPPICLQLASSLFFGLTHLPPPRGMAIAVLLGGGLWFLLLVLRAAELLKQQHPEEQR